MNAKVVFDCYFNKLSFHSRVLLFPDFHNFLPLTPVSLYTSHAILAFARKRKEAQELSINSPCGSCEKENIELAFIKFWQIPE